MIETLELRRLLSTVSSTQFVGPIYQQMLAVPAATQPTVRSVDPANNSTNNYRDLDRVAAAVNLVSSGNGVDAATLNTTNVKLFKTSNSQFVNGTVNTSGGGDTIVYTPFSTLAANTQYTFQVTTAVKDTAGNAFVAFTSKFTTGTQLQTAVDTNIQFSQTVQSATTGHKWASLAWGPDGKLYAGTLDGSIFRYTVAANGTLSNQETFSIIKDVNGSNRYIIGIEFDPASTANDLTLWVTHNAGVEQNAPNFSGKLTRLKGPNLEGYKDFVVNLPRSVRDHLTNQLHFGHDGAIYFSQAAMNAFGAPDPAWVRAETPLSSAVLRVNVKAITSVVDVKTPDGGGTYNPAAANAPVTIYATGVRNGYDFVFHSNGHMYMPVNGSAAGGSTPAGPGNQPPALTNIAQTENDFLLDVLPGGYYGHPNPTRSEYTLDAGNVTGGTNPLEFTEYPLGTQPDPNYRGIAYDFGKNYSPDGILEYKSTSFGGKLKGRMLVTRYSGADDIFILTPGANGTITGASGVGMEGFNDPLDLVEDPITGNVYVAELGNMRIVLLKPSVPPVASVDGLKLINADNTATLGSFKNNKTFNLAEARNLSVRADTTNAGSVIFTLDGANIQTESTKPFGILGNNPDLSYKPWTPTVGRHTLTVTSYAGAGGTGIVGSSITVAFSVIDQAKPFKINVNFQPGSSTFVFPKYRTDIGGKYTQRPNGFTYGWSSGNTTNFFNRDNPASIDERFDTGASFAGRTWSMAVPNGTYSVYVAGGDPSNFGSVGISVEGTTAINGTTTSQNRWLGKTVTVVVTDNTITLAALPGTTNSKINFIQIASIS